MKQKTLSLFSIFIICILCLLIGVLSTVIGCFCWVYNTPAIKEAFVETYNNNNNSFSVKETFGSILSGTVEINVPLALLELDKEPFDYKLTEEDKENGFTNIKKNSDGSATYTIKKKEYKEYLTELKKLTQESLNKISDDNSQTSINKIEYTDNFEKITIYANKENFENSLINSINILGCGLSAYVYQIYNLNSQGNCELVVKDTATGEIFETHKYPDSLDFFKSLAYLDYSNE